MSEEQTAHLDLVVQIKVRVKGYCRASVYDDKELLEEWIYYKIHDDLPDFDSVEILKEEITDIGY